MFHLVFTLCMFDMYFRSPIDRGVTPVPLADASDGKAAAKRLVLIVADGLRADSLFRFVGRDERFHSAADAAFRRHTQKVEDKREAHYQADAVTWSEQRERTSFLRHVIENRGAWGIAHTHVPTESRPGHVAIIAGMYEDVSAVTRGWKENPVEMDHVFNQSNFTWAFGSPDITRMFAKHHSHVVDYHYSSADEDFAAENLASLDEWVFERVEDMLGEQKIIKVDEAKLRSEKVVFFLHLLGLDSNGHAHRPQSPEYLKNVASVDRGVERIHNLFESYFPDGETAYVFMSDHGMSNKGNHGDGQPVNTRTPFVVWGHGCAKPKLANVEMQQNAFSAHMTSSAFSATYTPEQEFEAIHEWGLDHLARRDIEQADAAPLMATLLGINIPVNSVGTLPLAYLEPGPRRARAFLRNAEQLIRSVRFKEEKRRRSTLRFRFFPYAPLKGPRSLGAIANVRDLIARGHYYDAEYMCKDLIRMAQNGLRYYQQYDRSALSLLVLFAFVGWAGVCAKHAAGFIQNPAQTHTRRAQTLFRCAMVTLALVSGVIAWERGRESPLYLLYAGFPLLLWYDILRPGGFASWTLARLCAKSEISRLRALASLIGCYAATQLVCAGYSHREVFAALLLAILPFPWFVDGSSYVTSRTKGRFAFACALLAIFLFLPLDMGVRSEILAAGCAISIIFSVVNERSSTAKLAIRAALMLAASFVAMRTDALLAKRAGVPAWYRIAAWACCGACLVLPRISAWLHPSGEGVVEDFGALAPCFALLSVNYELLFLVSFAAMLDAWQTLERELAAIHRTDKPPQHATLRDVCSGLIFVVLSHVAFFGQGNVATMGSFELASTYRFDRIRALFNGVASRN